MTLEVERLQEKKIALAKAQREEIKDWVAIIGGTIAALAAIGNFILALRKDRKDQDKDSSSKTKPKSTRNAAPKKKRGAPSVSEAKP